MRRLDFFSTSADECFAAEYVTAKSKPAEPVFFTWFTSPTVMLGKYQNAFSEINPEYLTENNIKLVRRYSGGGTIYTDPGTLQYSIIEKSSDDGRIDFSHFIVPFTDFLNSIGVPAVFEGRNDLTVLGKKISGNAQYILDGYTVHHGSVLFDCSFEHMENATSFDKYKIVSKGIKSNRERVMNIKPLITVDIKDIADLKKAADSFLSHGEELYKIDAAEVMNIKLEHFEGIKNALSYSGSYTSSAAYRFDGGLVEIALRIKDGVIGEVSLSGNFFASRDIKALEETFCGIRADKDALKSVLDTLDCELLPVGISRDGLFSLLLKCLPEAYLK